MSPTRLKCLALVEPRLMSFILMSISIAQVFDDPRRVAHGSWHGTDRNRTKLIKYYSRTHKIRQRLHSTFSSQYDYHMILSAGASLAAVRVVSQQHHNQPPTQPGSPLHKLNTQRRNSRPCMYSTDRGLERESGQECGRSSHLQSQND